MNDTGYPKEDLDLTMIKLEDGKYYRTRDGRKVGPMKLNAVEGGFWCNENVWYNDGSFYPVAPSQYDLVAEWSTKDDHIERTKRMIEVMQAYVDGEIIEGPYGAIRRPSWNWGDYHYRIAETPDSINWDHVAPEFKYMARDEDGNVGLYTDMPEACNGQWFPSEGKYAEAVAQASYTRGTVDWKNSLVTRPGVEA